MIHSASNRYCLIMRHNHSLLSTAVLPGFASPRCCLPASGAGSGFLLEERHPLTSGDT